MMTQEWRELKPSFATLSTFFQVPQRGLSKVWNRFLVISVTRLLFILSAAGFCWSYVLKMILLDLCKHRLLDNSFYTTADHL